MKKYTIRSLLTRTDEITEQRIAKQFPLTTDMETVFQRSLAKLGEDAEPANRSVSKKQLTMIRYLSAAACLILTIGLSVGVWAKRQKIEPLPPQETQTTTVTQTETRTETTAKVATESQMTEKQTAPTTKMTETTVTLPEVIASYTTAVQTSVITTAETTPEHTAPAAKVQTASSSTTAPIPTVVIAVPIATAYEGHYGTIPPRVTETSALVATTQTESKSTISTTIYTQSFKTEAVESSTVSGIYTDSTTVSIKSVPDVFPGYCLEIQPENIVITCTDDLTKIPDEMPKYTLDSDVFVLKNTIIPQADDRNVMYLIEMPEQSFQCTVFQYEKTEFSLIRSKNEILTPVDINGNHGFIAKNEYSCSLIWHIGPEWLSVSSTLDQQETLLEIARCFVQENMQVIS
ncbi:MAG: hypothetical protein IJ906_08815 [Oscillospiraceae bacterium]|nr:hypothetical protein [Oscillospiraceae bacterium]